MTTETVTTDSPSPIPEETTTTEIRFPGFKRDMVAAVGLILGGGLAFTMNLTDTFFAEAIAWVFFAWGALLLFTNLLEANEVLIVREDALVIRNPFRLWAMTKIWPWSQIQRMDIWVRRFDPTYENVYLQIYYNADDELDPGTMQREDTSFRPELANLIVERAGLKADGHNLSALDQLPSDQPARYKWN